MKRVFLTTLGLNLIAISSFGDALVLPALHHTKRFKRVYSDSYLKTHPKQFLKSIAVSITHSYEESGLPQYDTLIQAITIGDSGIGSIDGRCKVKNTQNLEPELNCDIVDSIGDIVISGSPVKGMLSLQFRKQNGQPVTLSDEQGGQTSIPGNKENRIYYLQVL